MRKEKRVPSFLISFSKIVIPTSFTIELVWNWTILSWHCALHFDQWDHGLKACGWRNQFHTFVSCVRFLYF